MNTAEAPSLDSAKVDAFMQHLMSIYGGSLLNYMIDIGHRTGLLTAAAAGPATSEELAARAGLTERYVREWLSALATGGVVEYQPETKKFSLPPEHAAFLTTGPMNLAPMAKFHTYLAKYVHRVARAFQEGGGVPYSEYKPEFAELMDSMSRVNYDGFLLDAYLPMVPGLLAQLQSGIRVADVCCGSGHALALLAKKFPRSTFVGYDLDDGAIERARAEATQAGLGNLSYEVVDAARLETGEPFQAVFVFDAIHDQVAPAAVLARIAGALESGGRLVMKEPRGADALEDDIGNPFAPILYSVSTLHCLTISLAHDGEGIGTMFGEKHARSLLSDAGFTDVEVHPAPGDPTGAVYVCRKAA